MQNKLPLLVILIITACTNSVNQTDTQNQSNASVDQLFAEFYEFNLRINPIESTKLGETKYNDFVANYISDDHQEDLKTNYAAFLVEIEKYNKTDMTSAQWLSLQVMKWDCSIKLEGLNNELVIMTSPIYNLPSMELTPIIQIQSLHLYFSQLAGGTSVQPFKTVEDYENWLSRMDDYLEFLDTAMANMREGMERNVVLPTSLIVKVLPQIASFITDNPEDHLFYQPIKLIPANINEESKRYLEQAYKTVISEKVIPKYRILYQFLEEEYLPLGRESSGIGALPAGEETYNYLIRLHTTTRMTADEIHQLGLSEVARIRMEMENIKQEVGFEGDLNQFFDHIRSSPEQLAFTDPQEVIDNFNAIKGRILANVEQVFELQPKADFEVRRTEAFREASASAEYVPGSKDATRPGTFYVPIPDVEAYNKFADEALFLHEAIPGHHFQLSLQQENQDLPKFLHPESLGVFVEGWALYAESLGQELGVYTDPIQYFGMLSMEMHRAIRLVVDTGIHSKGWTREEAIQYSLENEAESEASITSEIERYMATPGQALSYKIGQLKIRQLRNKAEEALGEKFDVREYHNQVLNSGSLPLVLLEEKINSWIEEIE